MTIQDIELPNPLTPEDIKKIIYGACFMGSGGGGPLGMALKLHSKIKESVYYINPNEMESNKKGFVVCDVGSPKHAKKDSGLGDTAPVNAFNTMKEYLENKGDTVSYLLPMELGTVNTLLPLYIASKLKETGEKILVVN